MSVWPAVMCSHALFSFVYHTLTNYGRVFFCFIRKGGRPQVDHWSDWRLHAGRAVTWQSGQKMAIFPQSEQELTTSFNTRCACETTTVLQLQTLKSFNYIHLDCLAPQAESEVISIRTLSTENGIQQQKCHSGQKQHEWAWQRWHIE